MKRIPWTAFCVAAFCSCTVQDQPAASTGFPEPPTAEHLAAFKELQGTWRVDFSPKHDGSSTFHGEGRHITYTFETDKVIHEFAFRSEQAYRLNPTTSPKQIDLIRSDSTGKPWMAKGIYEVKGNSLVVVYAGKKDADRPADFSEARGNERTVLYLVRE
jgi:uncharacterized protein (TIGR03067 family)